MATPLTLLGVRLDGLTAREARARVAGILRGEGRGAYLVTPNPEMLVLATKDPGFRAALSGATLSLADGFGIRLVAWLTRQPVPPRVTGTDFLDELCGVAAETGASVYFMGAGRAGSAEDAARTLAVRHPGLRVAGAERGGWKEGEGSAPVADMDAIRAAAPDVLVVPWGHGAQERFMAERLAELPSVRLAAGVGGALDFWSGQVRRAPRWVRAVGMEWAWRLLLQPRRWKRIFTALVVFPLLAIRERVR
jgi:N-acetylglucosaminyldiphosphoundecaprenol N-acetyl-beta-D-mannosaminyltransferase